MIEPAFQVSEQIANRRSSIAMIRGAVCLKAVDAEFAGCVQVPARIGPVWLDMAVVALGFALHSVSRHAARSGHSYGRVPM